LAEQLRLNTAIITHWLASSLGADSTVRDQNGLYRVRFNSHDISTFDKYLNDDVRASLLGCFDRKCPADAFDYVPVTSTLARCIYSLIPSKQDSLKTTFHNSIKSGRVSRGMALKVVELYGESIKSMPFGEKWNSVVNDGSIGWTWVTEYFDGTPSSIFLPEPHEHAIKWVAANGLILYSGQPA